MPFQKICDVKSNGTQVVTVEVMKECFLKIIF